MLESIPVSVSDLLTSLVMTTFTSTVFIACAALIPD